MLIFAKDITQRDHKHAHEDRDPQLKAYMEYQRRLFPYTFVRAGLDLAYKELDDILNYIDNDHQPPADSTRRDFPADIPAWYRDRFPWSAAFLDMESMHAALVHLIQAMDSFRTEEIPNTYHLAVLYDSVHNIVVLYNALLAESEGDARNIHLSQNVPVHFDDFINNYWPHLHFMILSKPDFPHTPLLKKNQDIETRIQTLLGDGSEPLEALDIAGKEFGLADSSLALLKRDPVKAEHLSLVAEPQDPKRFDALYKTTAESGRFGAVSPIDLDYERNAAHAHDAGVSFAVPQQT